MSSGTDTFSLLGNIASLLGLIISLAGFAWTLAAVANAKRVAQGAKEAAERARADILRSNSMVELASAVTAMEEIKYFTDRVRGHFFPTGTLALERL